MVTRHRPCATPPVSSLPARSKGKPTTARPPTPLLDRINIPADMKRLTDADLRRLAYELRAETISAVSVTGGHLGAGLGVVELTVALHAVFDAPCDKIIRDGTDIVRKVLEVLGIVGNGSRA